MDKLFIELYGPAEFLDATVNVATSANNSENIYTVRRETSGAEEKVTITAANHGQFYELGLKTGIFLQEKVLFTISADNSLPKSQQK